MSDIAVTRPSASATGETDWLSRMRVRFGLLLALALLPWLVLTALNSYSDTTRSRLSESRTLDLIARNSVREIELVLDTGRLALDAAPRLLETQGCEAASEVLLDRLDVYAGLIVRDSDGEVICQDPESATRIKMVLPPLGTDEIAVVGARALFDRRDADLVLLNRYDPADGATYTLILPDTLGLRDVLNATMGEASDITIVAADDRPVLGRARELPGPLRATLASGTGDITFRDLTDSGGRPRRAALTYIDDFDLLVAVSRPNRAMGEDSIVERYGPLLLPVLVWAIGFTMIWWGTQTMLLRPIARVRGAARDYAAGNLGSRVTLSDSAAGEMQGLASTFNRMASELQDRNSRIDDNIDEKDTLLREIHHRVKNNLQIIISLLNMQERKVESEEAINAISETRARINAIAIVHRGLYESADLRGVEVAPFVDRLMTSLQGSLGTNECGVTLSHSVEPAVLTADSAIPVALFIVEGVGNAVVHGLQEGGTVTVDIRHDPSGGLVISVADNGRGLADPASMRGIGTRLMRGFARQLGGTLDFTDNAPGLVATLRMPAETVEDEPFKVSRKS